MKRNSLWKAAERKYGSRKKSRERNLKKLKAYHNYTEIRRESNRETLGESRAGLTLGKSPRQKEKYSN